MSGPQSKSELCVQRADSTSDHWSLVIEKGKSEFMMFVCVGRRRRGERSESEVSWWDVVSVVWCV